MDNLTDVEKEILEQINTLSTDLTRDSLRSLLSTISSLREDLNEWKTDCTHVHICADETIANSEKERDLLLKEVAVRLAGHTKLIIDSQQRVTKTVFIHREH